MPYGKIYGGFHNEEKILAIFLVVAMVAALAVGLTACKKDDGGEVDYSNIKIGMLCLHDKNSTYDKNFITAMEEVQRELGLRDDQVIIKTGIPEDDTCYQEAMNLVDAGCNIIFADSFGHEAYMLKAAKKLPKFCLHTQPERGLTPKIFLTLSTHSLPFTKVVSSQALPQV